MFFYYKNIITNCKKLLWAKTAWILEQDAVNGNHDKLLNNLKWNKIKKNPSMTNKDKTEKYKIQTIGQNQSKNKLKHYI